MSAASPKRKPLLQASEPDYPKLERVRQKLKVYAAAHGHRNMLDALDAILSAM